MELDWRRKHFISCDSFAPSHVRYNVYAKKKKENSNKRAFLFVVQLGAL